MEIANPVGTPSTACIAVTTIALNERPVVGRPPRRTPAVKSSPLQFSGFSVVQSRDIRAIRGSSVF
jgi:hypothetical protein